MSTFRSTGMLICRVIFFRSDHFVYAWSEAAAATMDMAVKDIETLFFFHPFLFFVASQQSCILCSTCQLHSRQLHVTNLQHNTPTYTCTYCTIDGK